jgi:hypothetical protein
MDALLDDPLFHTGMPIVSDRRRLVEAPTTAVIQMMAVQATGTAIGSAPAGGPRDWPGSARRVRDGSYESGDAGRRTSRINLRPFTDIDEAIRWRRPAEPAD